MTLLNIADLKTEIDAHEGAVALIVTALNLEQDAVLGHIQGHKTACGIDGTVYDWGHFAGEHVDWLVVAMTTGPGNIGSGQQVTAAIFELGTIDLILFSGVAGSRKKDLPIGSVVAASKVYFAHHGKAEDGQVYGRTHLVETRHHLTQLASYVCRGRHWFHRVAAPHGGAVVPEGYHPGDWPPLAIVKPIAAGGVVSADPDGDLEKFIDQTSQDAVAIEMEGYGVMYAGFRAEKPVLVIRGISDARVGKTAEGDAYDQPHAAALAAAFVFEVLHIWADRGSGREVRRAIEKDVSQESHPESIENASVGQSQEVLLVLAVDGDFNAFSNERLESIVDVVRSTAGVDVKLVEARPGSVRLILSTQNPQRVLAAADLIGDALYEKLELEMLGLADFSALEQADDLVESLASASVELLSWPMQLPAGQELDRPEFSEIMDRISSNESSTTVLTGGPGLGKSALLARVGNALRSEGVAFLAIKADALPSGLETRSDLSSYLGLEGRLDDTLKAIAIMRPVVVVLDQLDALASSLDLKTERLNLLLNIVRRLSGTPNIHFVLSVREFEYRHDVRLRTVEAEQIELAPPGWPAVQEILAEQGYDARNWPIDAQEMLRTPQVLVMFQQLAPDAEAPPFTGYQTLLDAVWEARLLAFEGGAELSALLSDLALEMAETEQLWLPRARYEARVQQIQSLEAKGFLATSADQKKIGFSHQTLFDHALARRFTSETGSLPAYVRGRQDSLFVRSKLWSALTYLREVDIPRYAGDLSELFSEESLPRHLVHLLLDFLGQQTDPLAEEWPIMLGALQRDKDRPRALAALVGSSGWFDYFADTAIASAMSGSVDDQDFAARILIGALPVRQNKVTDLLQDHWVGRDGSEIRLWNVISRHRGWSEGLRDIALYVIDQMDLRALAVDSLASSVGVVSPSDAVAIIARHIGKSLKTAMEESDRRAALTPPEEGDDENIAWRMANDPKEPLRNVFDHGDWSSLESLSQSHPETVLDGLWSSVVAAVEYGLTQRSEPPPEFGFPFAYTIHFDLGGRHGQLMEGAASGSVRLAVETLACSDPDSFIVWAKEAAMIEASEIQSLITLGYRQNPERLANEALKFLLEDPRRFVLHRTTGVVNLSARLIADVSTHWVAEEMGRIIEAIQAIKPNTTVPREEFRSKQWLIRKARRTRHELLSALPEAALPDDVRRELAAETRRFGAPPEDDDEDGVAMQIGSPAPLEAFRQGSVGQIINLLQSVPDQTGWDHPDRWMSGGSIQLSRVFADFAGSDPDKALAVIEKLDPAWGQRPAGYALEPLAGVLEPSRLMDLVCELDDRGFTDYEFRPSVARAIEKLNDKNVIVRDDVIDRLEAWLPDLVAPVAEPEHTDDDLPFEESSDDGKTQSILWAYRGGVMLPGGSYPVLSVLIKCLLRQDAFDRIHSLLQAHLDRADGPELWDALLRYFQYFRNMEGKKRDGLVMRLFTEYPQLLYSSDGAAFLARAQWWDGNLAQQLVGQLANAPDPRAQQALGEIATLVAILRQEERWAHDLVSQILSSEGSYPSQLGAAHSAANLWDHLSGRETTLSIYAALLPKHDPATTRALSDVFRVSKRLRPGNHTERLLTSFADALPEAPVGGDTFIVETLLALLPHHALLIARFAKLLAERWRAELVDVSTSIAFHARDLIDLAITLHRLGPETRQAGIDLFETMLEIDAYETESTLQELDRRFPRKGGTSQLRLRRPSRRRRARRRG